MRPPHLPVEYPFPPFRVPPLGQITGRQHDSARLFRRHSSAAAGSGAACSVVQFPPPVSSLGRTMIPHPPPSRFPLCRTMIPHQVLQKCAALLNPVTIGAHPFRRLFRLFRLLPVPPPVQKFQFIVPPPVPISAHPSERPPPSRFRGTPPRMFTFSRLFRLLPVPPPVPRF